MSNKKREGTAKGKLVSQPIEPSFFEQADSTLLTWLGMAGALINVRGTILLIDPLITLIEQDGETLCEGGHRLKISLPIEAADVPRADAVMYTHADGDHFVTLTAETLYRNHKPKFIAPPPVLERLCEVVIK
ncbi:MAG: MBL fold metallo-hydrolase [Planctomycetia bacterium]|nr:MBL fold metallo-hydrolase [Planctomycetia bacterium]